jgi:hypothetical protein
MNNLNGKIILNDLYFNKIYMDNLNPPQSVNVFISCRNLPNTDILSLTDAYVEVHEILDNNVTKLIGKTEVIIDNLNPDFTTSFTIPHIFSETQTLIFKVFDSDSLQPIPSTYIGEATCTLTQILLSQEQQKTCPIMNKDTQNGVILVRAQTNEQSSKNVLIVFEGEHFKNRSRFFHRFKPMFYLSHITENNTEIIVYKSEYVYSKNPHWKAVEISLKNLCRSDFDLPIKFQLLDHHNSNKPDFIANDQFTINDFKQKGRPMLVLKDPRKKAKKYYVNSGFVHIRKLEILPSFLDYIKGGCTISLHIAIDYTSSNGPQNKSSSLHYLNPNGSTNHYERALKAVSKILLDYDTDKQVPVYGFGGRILGSTSHCFHVNMNKANPNVQGVDEIVEAYRKSLDSIELSGPTLLRPFLHNLNSAIKGKRIDQNNQEYNIALILTDGVINDMESTIEEIVIASSLPISIIIVGIGNADFKDMEVLNANTEPLVDKNGVTMARDIVQFVAFREVGNSPERLRSEVLAEIPREIVKFFLMKDIKPNQALDT